MSPAIPTEPGGYVLRVSARARRARITVDAHGRVSVVVPSGFDPALAARMVSEREDWIRSARQRMAERYPGAGQTGLPRTLHLPATGESFHLQPGSGARGPVVRIEGEGLLLVRSEGTGSEAAKRALLTWLAGHLRPWAESRLRAMGEPHRLTPSKVALRSQRTRWGSCSAKGVISVNVRTAFLEPQLADYVLAHELAHLAEMNHAPGFWKRLEEIMPGAARLDRELSQAGRSLPGWLL
ncbi:MAG: SprT family zinc-dependent metalloprotease [Nitrospiraceae bacterium]|nr:SprT family zinc-dependent metalloprotease [Nitrospiraceae bacterium]MDA8208672.1 SprT family zinc-dependent metalloprotease [Actinomycetota bacterium]